MFSISGSLPGLISGAVATAANHGWFIDYTPYLNEEYLPTSNPNEWIAKPGSDADGRMDMLTVLLHEYGHALGLNHTADAHDFMAATLQPGVRRTLTVDEQLELMRLAGIFVTPESPGAPYAPTDPGVPVVVTGPAHGQVGLNADSTWTYVPAARRGGSAFRLTLPPARLAVTRHD